MKITTIEMRGLLTGKCVPRDMKVNEELAQYFVRKFEDHAAEVARLNEQVRALAAEGKAHQEVIFRLISMLSLSGYTSVQDSLNPAEALFFDAEKALDAPSTDAILREVGARAVKGFAAKCADKAHQCRLISVSENWKLAGEHAEDYAAKILAGEVPDA